MVKKTFRSLLEKAKQRDAYWVGKAIQDFTEDLWHLMEDRDVNKAELARRIGKTPAYVTKVFRGNSNFTIESMVKLAHALDGQLCIHVGRKEHQVRWFDVISRQPVQAEQHAEDWFKPVEAAVYEVEALGVPSNEHPIAA